MARTCWAAASMLEASAEGWVSEATGASKTGLVFPLHRKDENHPPPEVRGHRDFHRAGLDPGPERHGGCFRVQHARGNAIGDEFQQRNGDGMDGAVGC